MTKYVFFVLLSTPFILHAREQVLTLDKAKEIAIERSPSIQKTYATLQKSKAKVREIVSKYYPKLSLNSAFEVNRASARTSTRFENYLELSYTLFDGFERHYERISRQFQSQAATADYEDAKRILAFNVALAFYEVMTAQEKRQHTEKSYNLQLKIIDEIKNATQKVKNNLQAAKAAPQVAPAPAANAPALPVVPQGSFDPNALYREEARLRRFEEEKVRTQLEEDLAKVILAELMAVDPSQVSRDLILQKVNCDTYLPLLQKKVTQAKAHVLNEYQLAFDQRQDFISLKYALRAGGADVKAANAAKYPKVEAAITSGPSYRNSSGSSLEGNETTLALMLSWDIFDGGHRKAKLRQAEAGEKEQLAELNSKIQEIRSQVLRSLFRLASNFESYDIHLKNYIAAEELLKAVQGDVQNGLAEKVEEYYAEMAVIGLDEDKATGRIDILSSEEIWKSSVGNNLPTPPARVLRP